MKLLNNNVWENIKTHTKTRKQKTKSENYKQNKIYFLGNNIKPYKKKLSNT